MYVDDDFFSYLLITRFFYINRYKLLLKHHRVALTMTSLLLTTVSKWNICRTVISVVDHRLKTPEGTVSTVFPRGGICPHHSIPVFLRTAARLEARRRLETGWILQQKE